MEKYYLKKGVQWMTVDAFCIDERLIKSSFNWVTRNTFNWPNQIKSFVQPWSDHYVKYISAIFEPVSIKIRGNIWHKYFALSVYFYLLSGRQGLERPNFFGYVLFEKSKLSFLLSGCGARSSGWVIDWLDGLRDFTSDSVKVLGVPKKTVILV